MEVWVDIKGFDKYQVSNLGNVRHKKNGIVKTFVNEKGYHRVHLWSGKNRITKRLHRLVAEAFIENPNNLKEVNHIDEDKNNNKSSNLEWCSRQQNIEHSIRSGRFKIVSVNQYDKNNGRVGSYKSVSEAERATGISRTHICKVILGRYGFKSAGGYIWKQQQLTE